jgi:hypothetical protein
MTSEVLFRGQHLLFCRRQGWEYVEHSVAKESVMVVAVTGDGRIVLVEEFRPAVDAAVVCLPAGLVGDEGPEDPENAARRELAVSDDMPADPGPRPRSSSAPATQPVSRETSASRASRARSRKRRSACTSCPSASFESGLSRARRWGR